jgi:hypothetical protein
VRPRAPAPDRPIAIISALADDSMQGRRTATPGALRAARYLAGRMQAYGLEPAGDSAYFQRVPFVVSAGPEGERLRLGRPAPDSLGGVMALGINVIGLVRGSDPALSKEAVVVGAHYDHLGIGRPVNGDSVYNGADDDASGVAAVLTAAHDLAAGPKPRRTVIFLLPTGEEQGVLGTQYYLEHAAWPLERTVADLEGGDDRASRTAWPADRGGSGSPATSAPPWARQLSSAGLPVVADPRPDQSFFLRSDNIVFALRGIPAHTLSSYNMHRDYHQPSDEVEAVDAEHLERAAAVVSRAVRLLADGDPPRWHPGGQPTSLGP